MSSRLSVYPNAERRVRPIYDWLDNGNNKKALQEAEKVLKKQPNLQCAKVLKCLALLRLGKESDSLEQLEQIRSECPVDEATLQLMTVCYREMNKPNLICILYDQANQKESGNEEILTNLFLSYVRVGDYKKQQSTAMSLYRVKQRNQYYFWNIISLLIQTADNLSDIMPYFTLPTYYFKEFSFKPPPIENDKSVFLRLAEKMVEKHVSMKKVETDQEVLIYLIILEMQGKLKEALNVINGDLGKKLELSTIINKRIDLYIKMEHWAEANELLKSVLLEDIDTWNYIVLYLDTVFQLARGRTFNLEAETCPLYKAKEFLSVLRKENKTSKLKRGPYLAQLEFYSRLLNADQSGEKISGEILDCMVEYVEEFGTKEACLHDLRPYLCLVDPVQFLSQVCKLVSLKSGEYPKSRNQMNLHLTNAELVKVFGIQEAFPVSERLQSVNSMIQYFIHGLKFNIDLPYTELRSNDRYALLAVHTLYGVWAETYDYHHLFDAIVLCHYALHHSPSNSQLKTLLLKFYHLFGGCEGAHSTYLSLDLKHMQLDTLGYMHLFPLLANAEYNHARTVLSSTLKFFTNNFKESAEHITFAYKYDAWTRIPDFIHIREKLNFSTHYKQASIEKVLLDIFLAPNHTNTVQVIKECIPIDKIEWNYLQDNRDFTVLWDVDPENKRLNYSAIEQTYLLDIVFLRLRSLFLEICAACVQLGYSEFDSSCEIDAIENNEKSAMSSNYSSLKHNIYKLTMELANNLKTLKVNAPNAISNRFIAGPPQSRLIMFLQCNYFDPIINELKFLLCLLPGDHSNKENANIHLESIILFFKEFINIISEELIKCDTPSSRNIAIQMCTIFVEMSSFSCVVAGVCESVLRKFKLISVKKGKKTNKIRTVENSSDFDWRADVNCKYVTVVTSYIKYLETVLRSEEKSWKEKNLIMGEYNIPNEVDNEKEVSCLKEMSLHANQNLNNSYYSSINQISTILKQKLRYINSLKV